MSLKFPADQIKVEWVNNSVKFSDNSDSMKRFPNIKLVYKQPQR